MITLAMAAEGFTLTILAHGADNPNDAPVPYAVGVTNDEQPTLPSGTQWHIRASGYEATIVEVGGGLRALRHDGEDIVHGYAEDTMADAARGLLSGGPVAVPVTQSLLWAAGFLAVFAPLSVQAFRRRI